MTLPFVDKMRDDMQDQTYKLVSQLIINVSIGYLNKQLEFMIDNLDLLYILIHNRLKKSDQYEVLIDEIKNTIYSSIDNDGDKSKNYSQAFDKARSLFKIICKELDDVGILLQVRADLDTLVARRSE